MNWSSSIRACYRSRYRSRYLSNLSKKRGVCQEVAKLAMRMPAVSMQNRNVPFTDSKNYPIIDKIFTLIG
jgi:hypothetical protein